MGDVDGPGERLPPEGYGVHAAPVAARLGEMGLPARIERGRDVAWLRARLAEGRPVLVWATASLARAQSVRMRDSRDRVFVAWRGEHTFLAVGYGGGDVELLDPALGERKRVPWPLFETAWTSAGGIAVWAAPRGR